MLIECPACHAHARLPESKEGAKVRCKDCSRVFVARPRGAARKRATDPTRYVLIGGAVLVLGIVLFITSRAEEPVAAAPVEEESEPAPAPRGIGWDSELVRLARALHEHANADEQPELTPLIDGQLAWESRREAGTAGHDLPWSELPNTQQEAFVDDLAYDLVHSAVDDEERVAISEWEPFDGWVEEEGDEAAIVRVKVTNRRDPALADRHVEWRLVLRNGRWKATHWERWLSAEEIAALAKANRPTKNLVRKTLSDGSSVIESHIRPIEHLEETAPEERERIDALCDRLVDIDAKPAVRTEANRELVEIGKPAIPALLTTMAEIPLETEEQAMQLMQIHLTLQDITGYLTTFKPHTALGGTEERRQSGVKQWFGWYERRFRFFEGQREAADPLLDLEPRSEKERREFERIKRESEGGR